MPTENRSSTIEQNDHIEGIIDMVSVPREPTREMLAAAREVNGIFPTWRAMVAAAPAPQPHAEPIAWMVGIATWRTKEEAERDAAATRLPVVTLGPCAAPGDVERLRAQLVESDHAFVRSRNEAEQLRTQLTNLQSSVREFLRIDGISVDGSAARNKALTMLHGALATES